MTATERALEAPAKPPTQEDWLDILRRFDGQPAEPIDQEFPDAWPPGWWIRPGVICGLVFWAAIGVVVWGMI